MDRSLGAANRFQSLIGLKINWNKNCRHCKNPFSLFQSLIGLKINWNFSHLNLWMSPRCSFQSLIGLKINWNVSR